MFLVVMVVLLVSGLGRSNGRSRALSPESFVVFLQLCMTSGKYLLPDVKTDQGSAHLLSFLNAPIIKACTLKSSDTNCQINNKLLNDKLKLIDCSM